MKLANFKRTILLLALLTLTLTAVAGGTIAWFTDSVTSGENVIQSGNLDIELEYWNGSQWADVKEQTDILTNKLWEPGVTEIAYLKLKNAGSLSLKYKLGVNIASETGSYNVADEYFKLSNYIQFGVIENVNGENNAYSKDAAGRAKAIADVTEAKKISSGYSKAASMTAGQEEYLALVVYMPTTVGNEANYYNADVPTINLGINVYATQDTVEFDSFDNQYDNDINVIEISKADAYNPDWTHSDAFTTAMKTDNATILLGGGDYGKVPPLGSGVTVIGSFGTTFATHETALDQTLENVTFKNITFKGNCAIYNSNVKGTVTFENCTFIPFSPYGAHFASGLTDADKLIFKNCAFYGWNSFGPTIETIEISDSQFYGNGSYATLLPYGNATVTNCTFDFSDASQGSFIASAEGVITLIGCTNVNGELAEICDATTLAEGRVVLK